MNRGHTHKLASKLLAALTGTNQFYGWLHHQQTQYQAIVRCVAWLSTKQKFHHLPPKPGTVAKLERIIGGATFLRKRLTPSATVKQRAEIDTALKLVRQELKIIKAAEALKRGKQIID